MESAHRSNFWDSFFFASLRNVLERERLVAAARAPVDSGVAWKAAFGVNGPSEDVCFGLRSPAFDMFS